MRPCRSFFIALLLIVPMLKTVSAQVDSDSEQDKVIERLTIKNIEVPVRVLDGGQLVTDLSKDDFILIEGKVEHPINGFFIKRKRMDSALTDSGNQAAIPSSHNEPQAQRTFVLSFQVTIYNDSLKMALDTLFDSILRPKDQLLVFTHNSTRSFKDLSHPERIKAILVDDFRTSGEAYRNRLSDYIRRIEDNLKVNDFTRKLNALEPDNRVQDMIFFLEKYLATWDEYKKMYLMPRTDIFYNFARHLEGIKGEKWVLNFYQFELFPRIKLQGEIFNKMRDLAATMMLSVEGGTAALGNKLDQTLKEIYINMNMTRGFPMEEITKLFYKVDATFHSFFIRTQNPSYLQDFSYQSISTELEQLLEHITDATGGKNLVSNKVDESLNQVKSMEDVYYVLTYRPENPEKVEPIKIKMANRKGLTLLYDDNFRADYIQDYFEKLEQLRPQVKVTQFSFKDKLLAFKIHNFLKKKGENGAELGHITVRIRVMNQSANPIFDQTKSFAIDKTEMSVNLPAFKTLPAGEYAFLIDAVDHFSGLSDRIYEAIRIN